MADMKRVTVNYPCAYCGCMEIDVSATMMQCVQCRVVYGRCNGVWRIDDDTIPTSSALESLFRPKLAEQGASG